MKKETEFCDNCGKMTERKVGSISIDANSIQIFDSVAGCGRKGDGASGDLNRLFCFCDIKCLNDYIMHRCYPKKERIEGRGKLVNLKQDAFPCKIKPKTYNFETRKERK